MMSASFQAATRMLTLGTLAVVVLELLGQDAHRVQVVEHAVFEQSAPQHTLRSEAGAHVRGDGQPVVAPDLEADAFQLLDLEGVAQHRPDGVAAVAAALAAHQQAELAAGRRLSLAEADAADQVAARDLLDREDFLVSL